MYRKRDAERELLKDRSQMAFSLLITAFGTLLGYSTEQRGPTVTSCLGVLICHPPTGSAHSFWTTSWKVQERSSCWHARPLPGVLCTPWSPLLHPQPVLHLRALWLRWRMWAGLREGRKAAGRREHLQTLPCAWHPSLWRHSSSFQVAS